MVAEIETVSLSKGEAYIVEIEGLKTQFDVFRFMKRLTEAFGMKAFMVLHLPGKTSIELSANSVITNWPAELLSIYDQQKMLSDSALLRRLRKTTVPFRYDLGETVMRRDDGRTDVVASLFTRFGLVRGAYFPVHDPAGGRGAISFGGDREAIGFEEELLLHLICVHVYGRLAEIRYQDIKSTDSLTEREIDCLNWTAAGKTSAEIAEILGLSEHTVNHYLNRAAKKLDTVNRTQAVAKALRLGMIK
ncbi:LuxR family transcriptional regulator [Metarhizobium album]|uniref:LuxR family transcriptional regulator n=1 Tax=Metarhizobium album TaxID=2182425 RepID=A0A2U2DXD6_9HYPH|nr:LuxR family transcriptional regulator [Rhizobium album]PWE57987.1 LuxR family transcriptional regulator [Rhizobium album]